MKQFPEVIKVMQLSWAFKGSTDPFLRSSGSRLPLSALGTIPLLLLAKNFGRAMILLMPFFFVLLFVFLNYFYCF